MNSILDVRAWSGIEMRDFLKKVLTTFSLVAGVVLGISASFFIVIYLLSLLNIKVSLAPLNSDTPKGYVTPRPYTGFHMRTIRSKKTHHYTPNLPDLSKIDDLEQLKALLQKSLDTKEFYDAGEVFDRIKELNPEYPDLYWYLGLTLEGQEEYKEATKAFADYGRRPDSTPERLLYIANYLMGQKDYKKALAVLDTVKKAEESVEIYYLIAKCYYSKGDCKKAEQNIKLALKIDTNYPDIYDLLADCHIRTGNISEAIKAYDQAFLAEARPYFLYRVGLLAGGSGDYKTAKAYLNRYMAAEINTDKVNEARQLLTTYRINAMKHIPAAVEQQNDSIPAIRLVGIVKTDHTCRALLTINGVSEEVRAGDTVLTDYYVIHINESRIVLIREEEYYVLRPM